MLKQFKQAPIIQQLKKQNGYKIEVFKKIYFNYLNYSSILAKSKYQFVNQHFIITGIFQNNNNFLMIDLDTNPLYYAAIGGIILGIATSLHYVLKGNVTGMSGILFDVFFFHMNHFADKIIIIGGMFVASGIFFDIFGYGTSNKFTPFGPKDEISNHTSYVGYALAGLLVGFGTKLGNGCTSGHGLCGLPRFSIRSFVAVGIFLSSAIGIATIKYYFTLGPFSQGLKPTVEYEHLISANLCIVFGVAFTGIGFIIKKYYNESKQQILIILRDNLISFIVGVIFGSGLIVSGMVRRINILQFLWMCKIWNPSLLFVLGCGVGVNLIFFNYMIKIMKKPIYGQTLFNPHNSTIDWKLILGAFCFGIGWGIGGLCPGPAIVLFSVFQVEIHVIWLGCLIIGMFAANKIIHLFSNIQQSSKLKVNNESIDRNQNAQNIQNQQKNSPQNSFSQTSSIMMDKKNNLKQKNKQNQNCQQMDFIIESKQIQIMQKSAKVVKANLIKIQNQQKSKNNQQYINNLKINENQQQSSQILMRKQAQNLFKTKKAVLIDVQNEDINI